MLGSSAAMLYVKVSVPLSMAAPRYDCMRRRERCVRYDISRLNKPFIRSNEQVQLSAVELFVFGNDIVFLMRLN